MSKKFSTKGKTYKSGKIVDGDIVLIYPDSKTTNGIGEFIDKAAFDAYIGNTYSRDLTNIKNGQKGSSEKVVFDIGKTALMFLLSQPGCEGIRLVKIIKENGEPSFIIYGISDEVVFMAGDKILSKSLKGIDGNDPVRDEEIHNFTFEEVYKHLPGEMKFNETASEIFNAI